MAREEEKKPQAKLEAPIESQKEPIVETETHISYLGVALEKAENQESAFVPEKGDWYKDYINDEYALGLQKRIATGFKMGAPVLVEGGTSLGKTTTVLKMCADLGWEVHYANLNGNIDVENLMGKYIPNVRRKKRLIRNLSLPMAR